VVRAHPTVPACHTCPRRWHHLEPLSMPYSDGATYYQVRDELSPSRSSYPNGTTIAEFRPNSLTLHFHNISRESIAGMSNRKLSGADLGHVEVLAHELTHWSDQISSVWGQNYIVKLFDAYNASISNQENQFYQVVDLFDAERRILLPLYYHVVEKTVLPHDATKPWRISFSTGQEFDPYGFIDPKHPLFFVRFGDSETGAPVARQPITIGSLLETTATWSELRCGLDVLQELPVDERLVETVLWKKRKLETLYDPQLTVYTAPVHMLAFFSRTTEMLRAYEHGAVLASVALNLTDSLFDSLLHPGDWGAFGERMTNFVRARNRGYLFAVLARNAESVNDDLPVHTWLSEVLSRSGLPAYDVIMHHAYAYLEMIGRGLPVRSPLDHVRDYLLQVGRSRAIARYSSAFIGQSYDPLGGYQEVVPPMFDCNGTVFYRGIHTMDPERFDPEAMHQAEWSLRNFSDNFLQGCRGLRL
jgi:hypothetical protein